MLKRGGNPPHKLKIMYNKIGKIGTSFDVNNSTEGETIEQKIARALNNGEGITDSAQVIYTERKQGVLAEYNIRTDKWEIAVDAMDKIQTDNTAKRQAKIVNMNENKSENGTSE